MAVLSTFWSLDGSHRSAAQVRAMQAACEARGGNAASGRLAESGGMCFGLSPGGPPGRLLQSSGLVLVADARLTGRAELAGALDLGGDASITDERLLLAAWLRWGERCVDHLSGGFAFVVWNPRQQTLFAARDHTGERPLFYVHDRAKIAFCSSQPGLLALPSVSHVFRAAKVIDYVSCTTEAAHQTFFEDIHRLAPGTTLTLTPDSRKLRTYWNPLDTPPTRLRSDEDYAEALTDLVDAATRDCLPALGRVGSHLTAGLDSSTVAAAAALELRRQQRGLYAFTAVPRPGFAGTVLPWGLADEGPSAAETAALYPNVQHLLVTTAGRDPMADVAGFCAAAGEPVANPVNCVWMLAILHEARRHGVSAIMTGQAGNATISYEGTLGLRELFRAGRWMSLLRLILELRLQRHVSLGEALASSLDGLLPACTRRAFNPALQPELRLLHPQRIAEHALDERARQRCYEPMGTVRDERRCFLTALDLSHIRAALERMTCVASYDPTADKRLYEFCFSIPVEQFLKGGRTRSLVRRAMRRRLPADTLERRARGFQGADWHATLAPAMCQVRQELALIERSPAAQHYLNLAYLRRLVDTFPNVDPDTRQGFHAWNTDLTRGLALGNFLRTQESSAPIAADVSPAPELEQAANRQAACEW